MKTLIVALSLFSIYLHGLSQSVSVELSVRWINMKGLSENCFDTVRTPILDITYRNLSNKAIYLLRLSESKNECPITSYGGLFQTDKSLYKSTLTHSNYSNNNYNVLIGGLPLYKTSWWLTKDKENKEESELDMINDDLTEIYEDCFATKLKFSKIDSIQKMDFTLNDLTEKNIEIHFKNKFVFLDIGEEYVDSYNLIGFKILGGNFNFKIENTTFYNYVLGDPVWREDQQKWVYKEIKLPERVGKYDLYDGPFLTNSVVLNINNK